MERLDTSLSGDVRYDIRVGSSVYRTQHLVSNVGAESLRGRGTRVWAVKKLSMDKTLNNEVLVLKDSWIDKDRKREGQILTAIRESQAEESQEDFQGSRYLLTAVDSWDVEIDGNIDSTQTCVRDVLRDNGSSELSKTMAAVGVFADPLVRKQVHSKLPPRGGVPTGTPVPLSVPEYPVKIHHRVVFKELGETVLELESMSRVFHCLADVVRGKLCVPPSQSMYSIRGQVCVLCMSVVGYTVISALAMFCSMADLVSWQILSMRNTRTIIVSTASER